MIHSTGSTTVTSVQSHISSASPTTSQANNKPPVITQNIHAKLSSVSKDDRQQQQPESLVVSVPLSSATTVPGIQLPTTNSTNNSSNSSSTVSTIVTNQAQQQHQPPPVSMSSSSSSITQGSLYQQLTNNQPVSQRVSPLIQQSPMGRSSPITPTPNSLTNDVHGVNNHTSVLQNMSAGTGGVISSAGFHGISSSSSPAESSNSSNMLKVVYEKQPTSRIQVIQHEETSRRSRYVTFTANPPNESLCRLCCCYDLCC